MKDKEDNIISTEGDTMARRKEHFQTNLSRPEPCVIQRQERDTNVNIDAPTAEEVKAASQGNEEWKGSGCGWSDCNGVDVWRNRDTKTIINTAITNKWDNENTLATWKIGLIFKLPKTVTYQTARTGGASPYYLSEVKFSATLFLNLHNRREQAGFRPGRSC